MGRRRVAAISAALLLLLQVIQVGEVVAAQAGAAGDPLDDGIEAEIWSGGSPGSPSR